MDTLSDYMKAYYKDSDPSHTLSDGMKQFFEDAKVSIPLSSVGAPQADPDVDYMAGAPQPEPA